ncbi:MAG: hypothetical protein R6U32_02230 [Candidatus Woesearchaeota archaeon]
MQIKNIILSLESYGPIDIVLPFILIFTIIYAILSRTGLFKKNLNMVVSLVMALTTVIPHVLNQYPPCWDVVVIINHSLPKIAMFIIAIICFFLVLGVLGVNLSFFNKFMGWIVIIIFGFVTYTFLTSRGRGCYDYDLGFLSSSLIEYIAPISLFILIIWFITRDSDSSEDYDIY